MCLTISFISNNKKKLTCGPDCISDHYLLLDSMMYWTEFDQVDPGQNN